MIRLGQLNSLQVLKTSSYGVTLDGGDYGSAVLTSQQLDHDTEAGEWLQVFVYLDASGGLVASIKAPVAVVGEVAWLEIVEVNAVGAFAAWGLTKDLFIPYAEQQYPLRKGGHSLVRIYLDNQQRLAGSTRIDHWIKDDSSDLKEGEEVALIIGDKTELGYKAIINHRSWGLLYSNELYQRVRRGQSLTGYVRKLRTDGKADLSLVKPGYSSGKIEAVAQDILARLQQQGGRLAIADKSPPELIYAEFKISKKVFKQAIGLLFKQRRINLEPGAISLREGDSDLQ